MAQRLEQNDYKKKHEGYHRAPRIPEDFLGRFLGDEFFRKLLDLYPAGSVKAHENNSDSHSEIGEGDSGSLVFQPDQRRDVYKRQPPQPSSSLNRRRNAFLKSAALSSGCMRTM